MARGSSAAEKRRKKLLSLQQKMEVSDAMEKRMQMESFSMASDGSGTPQLPTNVRKSIEKGVEAALSSGDFRPTPSRRNQRRGSQSMSWSEIRASTFLGEQLSALVRFTRCRP